MTTHLRNLPPEELTRLSLLASISKMLNTSYDVDELLTRVMDVVLVSLNAQRGFVILARGQRRKIAVTRGIEKDKQGESSYSQTVVDKVLLEGVSVLSTDAGQDVRFAESKSMQNLKIRSVLCSPLLSQEKTIGAIYLDNLVTTGVFRANDAEMLEILCDLSVTALERAHYFNRTIEAEAKQRGQLKEVIRSATGGKLQVLERAEIEEFLRPFRPDIVVPLQGPEDVGLARREAENRFSPSLTPARVQDLVLCVSEGATNVVRHGGGGGMSLGSLQGRALAYFADTGPGIDPDNLPQATLWPGFSTKTSMGFGFSVLLKLLDRITLHSGPAGTHLVLELALSSNQSFDEQLLERLCERIDQI